MKKDVLLHFPYHSFDSIIDLLREAAISPYVDSIKITCYRLASRSKVVNALISAVRNGKEVTVMMELKARFDEEANLEWKNELEEAGAKVLIGTPELKVHAKLCLIRKKENKITSYYGFAGTGNLNEKTALVYGDHCLLTSDKLIMADINRIFNYLENPKARKPLLQSCKALLVSPVTMRNTLYHLINKEIKAAKKGKPSGIMLKLNSLSDTKLIDKLYEAANSGVPIKMIVRGICCMLTENKKFKSEVKAISIVDEYLEHARVMVFHNGGNEKVYISSADWMLRNLNHRVEAACPVYDDQMKKEICDLLNIQLKDNTKARILDNELTNQYVRTENKKSIRSQVEIYNYLYPIRKKNLTEGAQPNLSSETQEEAN